MAPLHNFIALLVRKASFQGFTYCDRAEQPEALEQAVARLTGWHAGDALNGKLHLCHGVASFNEAMEDILAGRTVGKVVIRV